MKAKRMIAALMLSTMVLGQASSVSAGTGKEFKNFKMDTRQRSEDTRVAVGKAKADNEQRWYLTLTKVDGLGTETSNSNGNALAFSSTTKGSTAPIPLFKSNLNRTVRKEYYKEMGAKKNTWCNLHIGSNSNNKKSYKLRLAGKYSS